MEGAGGRGPERFPCLVAGRRSQEKALKSELGKGLSPVPGVGDQGKPSQSSGLTIFTRHTPPQLWLKSGHTGRVPCQQTGEGPESVYHLGDMSARRVE